MSFQQLYERSDGSRVMIEPVPEIDSFYKEAFQWSYIVYNAAPGQDKFEDVTPEHLQGQAYVGVFTQNTQGMVVGSIFVLAAIKLTLSSHK